jgi:hypothetical protein
MKPSRLDAKRSQMNREADIDSDSELDDSSQSGIRTAVNPNASKPPSQPPSQSIAATAVTVVFRGVLPMERLVHMIRRRAAESAPATPLCVEVEQHADAQRWRVRVHSPRGELSALEAGPFLAVTRAFALLNQSQVAC